LRDILTAFAAAMIVLILAALVGPMMVDWSAQRLLVERELSAVLGQRVRVSGAIDVRLLPTPVLDLKGVSFGELADNPVFSADGLTLEISPASMLKGEVQIIDARLEAGRFDLRYDKQGGLSLKGGSGALSLAPIAAHRPVAVEHFAITRSTLLVDDGVGGAGFILTGLELDVQAATLAGPWRISGRGALDGHPVDLRLATSSPESDGSVRLGFSIAEERGRSMSFDGRYWSQLNKFDGQLTLGGRYNLQNVGGIETRQWTATSHMVGVGRHFDFDGLEIDGGADTGLKANGTGVFDLTGQPLLQLDLSSRALDMDFPVAGKEGGARLPDIVEAWLGAFQSANGAGRTVNPVTTRLRYQTQSLTLGSENLRDLVLALDIGPRGGKLTELNVILPGRSQLSAKGDIGSLSDLRFSGPLQWQVDDPTRFAQWFSGRSAGSKQEGVTGKEAAAFRPLGSLRKIQFDGEVTLESGVFASRIKMLTLDQSSMAGFVRFTPGDGIQRPRLEAQIASERLTVDDLPDLSPLSMALGSSDLVLAIEARAIRVGGETATGRLTASIFGDANGFRVDRLDYNDGNETRMTGGGRLSEEGGTLSLHIEARRLRMLAALFGRFMPADLSNAVLRRADEWVPLSLDLTIDQSASRGARQRLSLSGRAAGTQIAMTGDMPAAKGFSGFKGTVSLDHSSFPVLLRQLGLAVPVLVAPETGRIAAEIDLASSRYAVRFLMPNVILAADLNRQNGELAGKMTLKGADLAPLVQSLGLSGQSRRPWPVDLSGPIRLSEGRFGFGPVAGSVAGAALGGDIAILTEDNRVEGTLILDRLSLADVLPLALGPILPPNPGSLWSSARFAAAPNAAVESAIGLQLKSFDFGAGVEATNVMLRLTRDNDYFGLALEKASMADGQANGMLRLKREGGRVGMTAHLTLQNSDWTGLAGSESGLAGRVDLDLDLGAAGDSIADLVSHNSGGGKLVWRDGRIAALEPEAVLRVIAANQAIPEPMKLKAELLDELKSGPFRFKQAEAPLTVTDGVVRLSLINMAGPAKEGSAVSTLQASGQFDLRNPQWEAKASLLVPAPKGWKGPAPELLVQHRQSVGAGIERDINISAIFAALTMRAVDAEAEKLIEAPKKQ
jgi:hypothetical protein